MMKQWRLDDGQIIYGIAPLEQYLAALGVSERCQGAEWRMLLITGEAGVGKTVGARIFAQGPRKLPVRYLQIPSPQMVTPRYLLDAIGAQVGYSFDLHLPLHEAAREISELSRHHPCIIILDDAQSLIKGDILDMVRWLHDASSHVFVLCGLPRLDRVFHDRGELGGRVVIRHQLRLPTADEISPIFDGFPAETVAQVFQETGGRMRQIMGLRRWLDDLIEQGKFTASDLSPKQVQMISKHFVVRAA
jgi:DNA transposition AAA+ family ATPase